MGKELVKDIYKVLETYSDKAEHSDIIESLMVVLVQVTEYALRNEIIKVGPEVTQLHKAESESVTIIINHSPVEQATGSIH
jgi:hypothetical protein